MLMISCHGNDSDGQSFKLEGKLLEPWIDEVIRVVEPERRRERSARLDLSGLTYVDHSGAALLRRLLDQGLELEACSGFVAEMLHLEVE